MNSNFYFLKAIIFIIIFNLIFYNFTLADFKNNDEYYLSMGLDRGRGGGGISTSTSSTSTFNPCPTSVSPVSREELLAPPVNVNFNRTQSISYNTTSLAYHIIKKGTGGSNILAEIKNNDDFFKKYQNLIIISGIFNNPYYHYYYEWPNSIFYRTFDTNTSNDPYWVQSPMMIPERSWNSFSEWDNFDYHTVYRGVPSYHSVITFTPTSTKILLEKSFLKRTFVSYLEPRKVKIGSEINLTFEELEYQKIRSLKTITTTTLQWVPIYDSYGRIIRYEQRQITTTTTICDYDTKLTLVNRYSTSTETSGIVGVWDKNPSQCPVGFRSGVNCFKRTTILDPVDPSCYQEQDVL
jgi:hypothetical protein